MSGLVVLIGLAAPVLLWPCCDGHAVMVLRTVSVNWIIAALPECRPVTCPG